MGTGNNGRIYNNSSEQVSGYLWISNEMHYQEMRFEKQEWNLYYNGWWTSLDCDLLKKF